MVANYFLFVYNRVMALDGLCSESCELVDGF